MLKISTLGDIQGSSVSRSIKKYLAGYTQSILSEFQADSLQKFGCIYFLSCSQDTQKYKEMGLSQPLKDTPFEYCELITLKDSHEETKLLHGCYIFNNDFAIDVFGLKSIFDQVTLKALLKEA